MNVYKISQKQRDFIKNVVAKNGRTLIWNYLPGYTNGVKNDITFVKEVTGFGIVTYKCNEAPTVQIKNSNDEYKFEAAVNPMVLINDPKSEILASLKNTNQVIVARKSFKDYTGVFSTLPLHNSDFYRKIFREAGCHIYNQNNDFTYSNSGLLMIHTKEGGKRIIHLKNEKDIVLELPPYSTYLLNAATGEILLK